MSEQAFRAFQIEVPRIFFGFEAPEEYGIAGGAALLASDLMARSTDTYSSRKSSVGSSRLTRREPAMVAGTVVTNTRATAVRASRRGKLWVG